MDIPLPNLLLPPAPMKTRNHGSFPCMLATAVILGAWTAAAQEPAPTNPAPSAAQEHPSAFTNVTTELPPVTTNLIPSVVPPKQPFIPGGSAIRSSFSGKFVVPGRTLKLPAPETSLSPADPDAWNRALTFSMNVTDGNSDILRYGLGMDAAKTRQQDTTRIRAKSIYGESDGQKDTENAAAMLRHDRQLSPRFYALGNVDWMTDTIADIDYRVVGILSPGLHLAKSDRSVCKLELGAGYLSEKKGSDRQSFAAGRAAVIVEQLFNDHVLGWGSVECLPKLAAPDVFYLNAEAGLVSLLTRDLYINLTLEDRYDSAPALDKKSNDLLFTTSVSLKF